MLLLVPMFNFLLDLKNALRGGSLRYNNSNLASQPTQQSACQIQYLILQVTNKVLNSKWTLSKMYKGLSR